MKRREVMRVDHLEAVAAAAAEAAARAAAAAVEAAAAAAAKAKEAEAAVEAAKAARASTSAAAAAIARAPPPANHARAYPIAIPVAIVERERALVATTGEGVGEGDPRRRAPIVGDSADEMGDDARGGGADDAPGRVPRRRNDVTLVVAGSASAETAHAGGEGERGGSSARWAEVGVADLAKSSKLSATARGFVPRGKKAP
jgi:type II secretory pathway pseudopilin PulG